MMEYVIIVNRPVSQSGGNFVTTFYPLDNFGDVNVVSVEILKTLIKDKHIDPIDEMVASVSALRRGWSITQETNKSFDALAESVLQEVIRHDKMKINVENAQELINGGEGRFIIPEEDREFFGFSDSNQKKVYFGELGEPLSATNLTGRRWYTTFPSDPWRILQEFLKLENGSANIVSRGK